MYEVDDLDSVVELDNLPQSSVGAPLPCVLADEHRVILAYYVEEALPGWDGSTVRIVGPSMVDEPIAIVRFKGCRAHMFGPPNDEAFAGHPLATRGLRPYAVFRIDRSSWMRKLERMNSVHPGHRPDNFWKRQHLVFAFHDSTFECVCEGFEITQARGSMQDAFPQMVKLLEWERF